MLDQSLRTHICNLPWLSSRFLPNHYTFIQEFLLFILAHTVSLCNRLLDTFKSNCVCNQRQNCLRSNINLYIHLCAEGAHVAESVIEKNTRLDTSGEGAFGDSLGGKTSSTCAGPNRTLQMQLEKNVISTCQKALFQNTNIQSKKLLMLPSSYQL